MLWRTGSPHLHHTWPLCQLPLLQLALGPTTTSSSPCFTLLSLLQTMPLDCSILAAHTLLHSVAFNLWRLLVLPHSGQLLGLLLLLLHSGHWTAAGRDESRAQIGRSPKWAIHTLALIPPTQDTPLPSLLPPRAVQPPAAIEMTP